MDNNKELTVEEVILWIMDHTDDEEAMNKIANASYPYTTKYKTRYPDQQ